MTGRPCVARRPIYSNRLARIEQVLRTGCRLDAAHEVEALGPVLVSQIAIFFWPMPDLRVQVPHRDGATDLNNLAHLLRDTNRPGVAEPLSRRAVANCEESLGADNPLTVTVRKNLSALEAELGKGT